MKNIHLSGVPGHSIKRRGLRSVFYGGKPYPCPWQVHACADTVNESVVRLRAWWRWP